MQVEEVVEEVVNETASAAAVAEGISVVAVEASAHSGVVQPGAVMQSVPEHSVVISQSSPMHCEVVQSLPSQSVVAQSLPMQA